MKKEFYLTVNSNGTTKTTKSKPALDWNEIAIHVKLDLPDSLFRKPQLNATISVPESAVEPREITAEMQDNIKDAIEVSTGMEIRLSIEP